MARRDGLKNIQFVLLGIFFFFFRSYAGELLAALSIQISPLLSRLIRRAAAKLERLEREQKILPLQWFETFF